ncbi:uncharacterized protein TNCV_877431 [Trichonephila clavipes]|nr:uncharacterized protein TNCV_877431 [Trichonephila clavipes]
MDYRIRCQRCYCRILVPLKTHRVGELMHVKYADAQSFESGLPVQVSFSSRGCGSPVVKVSDHGRHVMSSSPVPLKTRRVGERCTLNLSRAETSSCWCDS